MKTISISNLFLFILLVGMTIIAFTQWQDKRDLKKENERLLTNQAEATNTIVERYVSKTDSIEHTVFKDRIVTRDELKSGQVAIDRGLLDSMVMGLKTADGDRSKFNKRITELTRVNARLQGTVEAIKGDPKKGVLYNYESKYLTAHIDTTFKLNYLYNAEVRVAAYEEPSGFLGLGKKKHYIDISSPDPNFKINSVDRFRIENTIKPKRWGVGLIAGWTVDPTISNGKLEFKPAVGLGVSFNVIRF